MNGYFFISSPTKLVEEGKWLLGVTNFERKNSVFDINNENNFFSITIPGHWNSESAEKTIDALNKLLELRSQNGIELDVQQAGKKGLILISDYFFCLVLVLLKMRYLKN